MVSGNLRNQQTWQGETGTLFLVGTDQTVTSPSLNIGRLVVQGGGTKLLAGDLTVNQLLALESGIVRTDWSLLVASGAQINGGSAQSYIEGFLYHAGTGSKFYPVGRNGTYAPVTLRNVTGDNPTVGIAYFPTPAFNGTELHWQQQVSSGTYAGSVAELTFSSDNADYLRYPDELLVLGAENGTDTYTVLGQSSLSSQGNRYTVVSEEASVLPVLTVGFDTPDDTRHLYLPNAFSPTAPAAEDQRIRVYGQKILPRNFYLAIQDGWGNVVYETTSWEEATTQGWGGPSRPSANVTEPYRYLLRGEFIGGKSFQKTGTIIQY